MNNRVRPLTGFKNFLGLAGACLFVVLLIVGGVYAVIGVDDMFNGRVQPIPEFSYQNNVLTFQDYNKNQYKLPLPKDIVIKPTDTLEIRYLTNRGEISVISSVHVNGNIVYSGNPHLPFTVTKFK